MVSKYKYCPRCGSKVVVGEMAVRHVVCPRCGYSETQVVGRVSTPSLLEGLIELIGILGLAALAAAGISMLLKAILQGPSEGEISERPRARPRKGDIRDSYYEYQRLY